MNNKQAEQIAAGPQRFLAERAARLGTEGAFEVGARARALEAQGRSIIHFQIGEPDFDTPPHVVEAGISALRDGFTHYGPPQGLPRLREAAAEDFRRTRSLTWASPEKIVVVPGAKPVVFYTILALVNPGDEVIYPDPGFPIYRSMVDYVGGVGLPLPLRPERQFRLDPAELETLVTPKTKLLILNSPHNPCGSVLEPSDLDRIAEICLRHNIFVLSDEIYSRLLYTGRHESVAARPGMENLTIVLDGFSKSYAMTGWRLGYGLMPQWLAEQMTLLMVNSNSCTATFTQLAGVAALEGPQDCVDRMLAEFVKRREVIVAGLNEIKGVSCAAPAGAFYAFPDIRATGYSSKALADRLLNEAGVALLAGSAFGRYGEGFLRISYANSLENIKAGIERFKQLLNACSLFTSRGSR